MELGREMDQTVLYYMAVVEIKKTAEGENMRKLFVSFVLASLVLSMTGIPVAASQPNTPPNIKKVTTPFAHTAPTFIFSLGELQFNLPNMCTSILGWQN